MNIFELLDLTARMEAADVSKINAILSSCELSVEDLVKQLGSFRVLWPSRIDDIIIDETHDAIIRSAVAYTMPVRAVDGTIKPIVFYNGDIISSNESAVIVGTVAHELVHVRQVWEGLLGNPDSDWCGFKDLTDHDADVRNAIATGDWSVIHKYPWEIEAYGAQFHVLNDLGVELGYVEDMLRIFYEVYPEYRGLTGREAIKLAKGQYPGSL